MLKISLIITTYNRPQSLALVLQALALQTRSHFEVIVADDGSTRTTTTFLTQVQSRLPYPLKHVWQEDQGFRAARVRNRAIAVAEGDYVVFLDGDCIPRPDFIAKHRQLVEENCFVTGHRILFSQRFTCQVIQNSWTVGSWSFIRWLIPYMRRDINRLLPLLHLPYVKYTTQLWQGAKTCNLGLWRKDILDINGFNEDFQGWGHEDAELVVRLLRHGIQRKEGRFKVPVFHLWHPLVDRSLEQQNRQRLEQTLHTTAVIAQQGIAQAV